MRSNIYRISCILIAVIYNTLLISGCQISGKPSVAISERISPSYESQEPSYSIKQTSSNSTEEASKETEVTVSKYIEIQDTKTHDNIKEVNGMALLRSIDSSLVIDLKYAGPDNFTGKVVYPQNVCVLRKSTALKLSKANSELKKSRFTIKVLDAYRPVYVQKIFWEIVMDENYIANPSKGGSNHNRGTAVDITLVDASGKEVEMPSKFDDFSSKSSRSSADIAPSVKKNLDLLTKAMLDSGFTAIQSEWWHFDDRDTASYAIIDINLGEFEEDTPPAPEATSNKPVTAIPVPQNISENERLLYKRLDSLKESSQVLFVMSGLGSGSATAYSFERMQDTWKPFLEPFPAVIGKNGFSDSKTEGDRTSPTGTFELGRCFSRLPNPGTKLDFVQFGKDDFWVDDSSSKYYNTFQKGPPVGRWKSAENLYDIGDVYKSFIVVEYNTKERIPGKGSAIFLHIWSGENSFTEGCTAISEDKLQQLIKWLDPAKKPLIIQGPWEEINK